MEVWNGLFCDIDGGHGDGLQVPYVDALVPVRISYSNAKCLWSGEEKAQSDG